jgi:hypothetical protein
MPLQNRVNPWGKIVATPERGTMMGNRGGRFHRPGQTLGKRRWATHHWICCELEWKGAHHEPMGHGYTSLFFLDEVTALAAGHRPCLFCRRGEARRFIELAGMTTDAFDRRLHEERRSAPGITVIGDLPSGTMIAIDGHPYAIVGDGLLPWSFAGYGDLVPRNPAMRSAVLTPPSIVAILRRGYQPRWHRSAGILGGRT